MCTEIRVSKDIPIDTKINSEYKTDLDKVRRQSITYYTSLAGQYFPKDEKLSRLERLHLESLVLQIELANKESSQKKKMQQVFFGEVDVYNEIEKVGFTKSSDGDIIIFSIDKRLDWILGYITGESVMAIRKGISENAISISSTYEEISSSILNNYTMDIPLSIFAGINHKLDILLTYLAKSSEDKKVIIGVDGSKIQFMDEDEGERLIKYFLTYIYKCSIYFLKIIMSNFMKSESSLITDDLVCKSIGISNVIYKSPSIGGDQLHLDLYLKIDDEKNVLILEVDKLNEGQYRYSRRVE